MGIHRSILDGLTHIIRRKDIPFLKKDLIFEVTFIDNRIPSTNMAFFCEDIICDELTKMEEGDFEIHKPKQIPCRFEAKVPDDDIIIWNNSVQVNYGNTLNKTVRKFFDDVLKCKTQEDANKKFINEINLESIKNLTDVYERKILTEKTL